MKAFYKILIIAALGALCLSACNSKQKPLADHVIVIALDGWGSAHFQNNPEIPNIRSLMENGSYTLKKRSVAPSSSAPNWASMFMGAGPELHGYTKWGSKTPELESRELTEDGIFPTVFYLLRKQRPESEIGCMYEWNGIKYVIDSLACNVYQQAENHKENPAELCEMSEKYIKEAKPNFFVTVFDAPDHSGHTNGFYSEDYDNTVELMDTFTGRIIQAAKDAGIYDDTIFIVTADHGGKGDKHGSYSLEEMETPFIVAGKNVKKLGVFDDSMMQYDVASTIAYIFGLTQPQVWVGRPCTQIFK